MPVTQHVYQSNQLPQLQAKTQTDLLEDVYHTTAKPLMKLRKCFITIHCSTPTRLKEHEEEAKIFIYENLGNFCSAYNTKAAVFYKAFMESGANNIDL